MDFKERFEELLIALEMNNTDFAKLTGFDKAAISQWKSGSRGIGDKNLMEIAKATGCNLKWLKSGKGQMFSTASVGDITNTATGGSVTMGGTTQGKSPTHDYLINLCNSLDEEGAKAVIKFIIDLG